MNTPQNPILPIVPTDGKVESLQTYLMEVNKFLADLTSNVRTDLDSVGGSVGYAVGDYRWTEKEVTLSATEPWLNLASPTASLDVAHYVDYVPYLRDVQAGPRWSSAVLTGTVQLTGTSLAGTSTNFDPELAVGDLVFIEKLNQFRYIATRTSDTAATVSEPGTAAAGARIWKITRAAGKVTTFPITSYQITAADSFSLWLNESSTTKQPENYIMMKAIAEAYATDREYGTITLPSAIGGIPAGDYQITSITLSNVGTSSAVIVCSASGLTAGSKTADTSNISIYPHRIAGNTTTARHYEVTDAAVMSDGLHNVLGMRTRDYMQAWQAGGTDATVKYGFLSGNGYQTYASLAASYSVPYFGTIGKGRADMIKALHDGTNETPRTGPRTHPRAMIGNLYVYIGSYTA